MKGNPLAVSPPPDAAVSLFAALEHARERGWATLATDSAGGHAWAFTREGQVAIHEAEERIARASAIVPSVTASQSSPARAGANGEREHHERERGTSD